MSVQRARLSIMHVISFNSHENPSRSLVFSSCQFFTLRHREIEEVSQAAQPESSGAGGDSLGQCLQGSWPRHPRSWGWEETHSSCPVERRQAVVPGSSCSSSAGRGLMAVPDFLVLGSCHHQERSRRGALKTRAGGGGSFFWNHSSSDSDGWVPRIFPPCFFSTEEL